MTGRERILPVSSVRNRWRKRQTVLRRCWYCEQLFSFPKWPGLHGETQYNEWYCPRCR